MHDVSTALASTAPYLSCAEKVWAEPHPRRAILREYVQTLDKKKCSVGMRLLNKATEDDLLNLIYGRVSYEDIKRPLASTTVERARLYCARVRHLTVDMTTALVGDEMHTIPSALLKLSREFPNAIEIVTELRGDPGPRIVRGETKWSYYGYRDIFHTGATVNTQQAMWALPESLDFKGFACVRVQFDPHNLPSDYDPLKHLAIEGYTPLPQPWLQDWRAGIGTFATEPIEVLLLESEVDMGMLVETVEYLKLHRASALPRDCRVCVSGHVTEGLLWRLMRVVSIYCESLQLSVHPGLTTIEPTVHHMLGLRSAPHWRRLGRKCRNYTLPIRDVRWSTGEAGWNLVPDEIEAACSMNGIGRGMPPLSLESLTLEVHPDHVLSFPAVQKEAGHPTSQDLTLAPPVMDEAAIILLDVLGDQCKVKLRPAMLPHSQERMAGVAEPDCPLYLGLVTQHRAIRFRRQFLKQRRHAAEHPEGDSPSWRKLEVHERLVMGN